MVTITRTGNRIRASGHANYSGHGTDIVCSAISILIYTLALTGTMETVGEVTTVNNNNKTALETILGGLNLLAEQYPQYVEVVE